MPEVFSTASLFKDDEFDFASTEQVELERSQSHRRMLKTFSASARNSVGKQYRFRAECLRDAQLFLKSILGFIEPTWTITPLDCYPDIEVGFKLRKEIAPRDLLWIASSIEDCHVVVQTLEEEAQYTGDRDYYRSIDLDDPKMRPSKKVISEMKRTLKRYLVELECLQSDVKLLLADC